MTSPKARWREKMFGYWQPRLIDGQWQIVMERMAKWPLLFIDEMDKEARHIMDEDEALSRARELNAINFVAYCPRHEYWLVKEMVE